MAKDKKLTSAAKAQAWETVDPLLDAMYHEFKELSKRKPDGPVSLQKIKTVNRLLEKCREALELEPTLVYLDLLDQDEVPQNSDAVLLLSQYVAAMKQFRETYSRQNTITYQMEWVIDSEAGD